MAPYLTEVPSDVMRLREAARDLLKVSPASARRYALKPGARGRDGRRHVLRTILVGGVFKTTPAWVAEFLAALNADPTTSTPASGRATTSQSHADCLAAAAEEEQVRRVLGGK